MPSLNLGVLAHVDAGKTSLTERLLHAAGVIDELGSVDSGSTQTDSLALERQRGITIRSAVVSFVLDGVTVNLVDTPGHPDFIAEVERVLDVLDGVVLVVSSVEGVQPQTRVLMRTLRRLGLPTLLFANKVDRRGARDADLLREVADRLTPSVVPLTRVRDLGSRSATVAPRPPDEGWLEVLAEQDDALLEAYVDGQVAYDGLADVLARQSRRGLVHPLLHGSAITGAGVDLLLDALPRLLPTHEPDPDAPLSATVFKVERAASGEKVALVRMRAGTLRVRDVVEEAKVTALAVFADGGSRPADTLRAGQIGRVWGLPDVRIGDALGVPVAARHEHFAPPSLETVVVPRRDADRAALFVALSQLAEQDPLIDLRRDDDEELSVSLYGEVQKEVIGATLADEHGVEVDFRETTTICVERLAGTGAAHELIAVDPNPVLATVGLRVEPAAPGAGITFGLEVELGSMPPAFFTAVEETVHDTLRQGLCGWQVQDCAVTMTHSGYWARQSRMHGGFDKTMSSTAGDFRHLTALVVAEALRRAGTVVHEPVHRFRLELPADALGVVLPLLAGRRAVPLATTPSGSTYVVEGEVPAAEVHALEQRLPTPTGGEGVLETWFDHYAPVRGEPPVRPRTGLDPLHRKEYLLRVNRRV